MQYDLVIKNGTVVDGMGLPKQQADVAIKDGLIQQVGRINAPANETIRRRRADRLPRLHRPAHALRRPAYLGPAGAFLLVARSYHGGDGELRLHARALPPQ